MAEPLYLVFAALLLTAWLKPIALTCLRALHLLQLEEYQTDRYLRWIAANRSGLIDVELVLAAIAVAIGGALLPSPAWLILAIAEVAIGGWASIRRTIPPAKKALVLTSRARRLLGGQAFWIGFILVGTVGLTAGRSQDPGRSILVGLALGLTIVGLASWPLLALANLLLYPVEAVFRQYYLRSARQILRAVHPLVIGVAGSYGKTSTKMILSQLLATSFPTLATPRSFNTPMGLCRVIREQLRPEHRFFIAELGAYQRGEIKELCRLVDPSIGILTSVGPEHLDRFGSMENVILGEAELIQALPKEGLAIVNGDDDLCRQIADAATCRCVFVGGPSDSRRGLWAKDVVLTSAGLAFTIHFADGHAMAVQTQLLGRHNVANILLASAAALECGLSVDDLPRAIARLEPIEHRLQLIANNNGVTVIDDTYNSNPRGATAALETLGSFGGGHRYLVTPGMVELADYQDTAHREFGRQAAAVCDAVILIGARHTLAIAEGLAEGGLNSDRLVVTRNLEEATERLGQLLRPGDAVLFENDLPDNYSE